MKIKDSTFYSAPISKQLPVYIIYIYIKREIKIKNTFYVQFCKLYNLVIMSSSLDEP